MQLNPFLRFLRFLQSLLAVAVLAAPLLAAAGPRHAVTVVAGAGSRASDLDNSGQVVGALWAGDAYHGYVFTDGLLNDIGTLGGGADMRACGIDNGVTIVGSMFVTMPDDERYRHACGLSGTVLTAPGTPPYGDGSVRLAINSHGDGVMTGFGNLDGPWGAALSINDTGQVAGYLGVDSLPGNPGELYPTTAFLYENGERVDLNTLIDPASGWTIVDAGAINDVRQVAANACHAGVCQAVRLDLVSAVPEPPLFAMLAAGLALGLARGKGGLRPPARRRRG